MSVVFILLVSYLLSFKHDNIPHVSENKNTLYLIYLLDATYLYIQVIPDMMLKSNVKPKLGGEVYTVC